MRIRLRAPGDDSEPVGLPPTALPPPLAMGRSASAQASPRTPSRPPQLDVRSPDFIEQRLENLKRKQNWLSFLDEYVRTHPEDDDDDEGASRRKAEKEAEAEAGKTDGDDDEDDDALEQDDEPGFFKSLAYAMAVVGLTPVWVVLFPVWKDKGPDFWPLGSPSLWDLYKRSLSLLAFLVLGVELLYFVVCKELPEWGRNTWYVLQVELEDMLDATKSCRAAVSRGNEVLVREMCAPIVIDVAMLQLTAWAMLKIHKKWGRVLLLVIAAMVFVDAPGKLNMSFQPLPVITGIDQPYALLDEEILVAFDGKNLQPGGTIAWVSYWGCASTTPVTSCELQFSATFDMGYAAVTFTAIDHFIPCYRNPPNPLKAEDFRCFEHIRLPVKDKQSIPGWSRRIGPGSGAEKKTPERSLHQELPGLEATKAKAGKRTSSRSKRKLDQKVKSVSVDAGTGELMDTR